MRIAIVTGGAVAGEPLRRIVCSAPGDAVAWMAGDGAEAVERCRQDTPDLLLMDLTLPVIDGTEAIRRIMAQAPCPILVVAANIEGRSDNILEALGAGAIDAVQMPPPGMNGQRPGITALRFKIEAIRRLVSDGNGQTRPDAQDAGRPVRNSLVAMGASAGGPAALSTILRGLPQDFPAPIVIVQHVDAQFVPLMASWLNGQSAVPVRVAVEGDRPRAGEALIAGTSDHLVFARTHSLSYTREPVGCLQRPSIDVFFESILQHWAGDVAGVLLTGMGRDGARGLKALRGAGFLTIAQNSATCAVYGMPKAAVELGAAVRVLPLEEIAGHLIDFAAHPEQIPG